MHLPSPLQVQFKNAKPSHLPGKAPARWIHVATVGEHVYEGEDMELTADVFDSFIRNFETQQNPLPVYLNHEQKQAEGWVLDLKREGEDLFARMEFGEDIAGAIAKGKWRFCSMGFSLESVSRDTGKPVGPELYEVSLVNEPFLDGLQPVSLQRRKLHRLQGKRVRMAQSVRDLIQKHLKEGGSLADFDSVLAEIKDGTQDAALPDTSTPAAPDAGAAPAASLSDEGADTTLQDGQEEALAAGGEAVAMLMEATGLGPAEVLAALRDKLDVIAAELAGTSGEDGTPADVAASRPDDNGDVKMSRENENAALRIKMSALQKKVERLEAGETKRAEQSLSAEVDQMVKDGKILPGARDAALKLMRANTDEARAILGDSQAVPVAQLPPEVKDPSEATFATLSQRNRGLVRKLAALPMMRGKSKDELAKRVLASQAKQEAN